MKKIFFYIPTLGAGGAEKQCSLIAAGLCERGYDIQILLDACIIKDSNAEILKKARMPLPVIVLPGGIVAKVMALRRLLRKTPGAVVFSFLTKPNLVSGIVSLMVGDARIYGGVRNEQLPWWKYLIELIVNRCLSYGTIMNSYRAYDIFSAKYFQKEKCRVISNAFVFFGGARAALRSAIVPTIVVVARFTPQKDYYTWLKVIRTVLNRGIAVKGRIVGWGSGEDAVRNWIDELDLRHSIEILPGDSDVMDVLSVGDIYLSTSLYEGVSNSILEAMYNRLPVVATNVGDNARMIEDGKSGYLAKIRDVDALATAVIKLASDRAMCRTFGERAFEILKTYYSLDKVLDQYEAVINKGVS